MLREDRLRQIIHMLRLYGKVEVNLLCRAFGVTEMTIRRDLSTLVEQNLAVRSHGGALLPPSSTLSESPYELRIARNLPEKQAIAREALAFLENGQTVFFDSSTTVLCIARLITNALDMVVVTDTLATALELNARHTIKIICVGGELRKNTGACCGVFAENMLRSMHFDIAFLGAPRVSMNGELSTSTAAEMPTKTLIREQADKVVLVVDHSKLGPPEFLVQGHVRDVDVLITDDKMPQDFLDVCRSAGTRVIVAEAE